MSFTDRIMVVVEASTGGAVREMDRLGKSTKDADKGVSALGKSLKQGLVAGAAAFAGAGLVSWVGKAVDQYGDAAKAAGELAKATGGSVQNVSRFTAAMADSGVESERSANLLRKFTVGAQKNEDVLRGLGVQFKVGKDGVVDYADAAVQAIDNLNGIKDAAERNRLAVQLFGKQGAAAFEELRASGVDLADAMEAVSKYRVFDQDDVARAVAYDDAVDRLGASMQGLAFAAGEKLIPAITAGADALAQIVEVMSAIPTEVYLAVGGFVALKSAMSFLGPSVAASWGTVATGITGLGAAASDAGGKGALLKSGFSGLVGAIGKLNIAFALGTAAIAAYSVAAENAQGRLEEFAATSDGDLKSAAQSAIETSSAWERFVVVLENTSGASDDLGEAIRSLFDKNSEGTQKAYEAALAETARTMGDAAAAATDLKVQQQSLNEATADFVNSPTAENWQKVADAAREAADAQGLVKQATDLAAEAMARASGDVGFFIDKLQQLENIGGSSVESLKASLESISFADVGDTWANEALIGAENAYDTLLGGLKSALEQTPNLDLSAWLNQFRGLSPELDAIIDQVLADVTSDANVQATLGITPDGTVAAAQTQVDALGNPITPPLNPTQGPGFQAANTALAEIAKQRNIALIVNTSFAPGGYEAVKARMDYLSQTRQGAIDVKHSFSDGGYNALKARSDYLAQNRNGSIGINVNFAPDGYSAIKARVDYLAQNRTATITQVVNQVTGTRAGGGAEGSSGRSANTMFSPINMVRVSLDGRELRSVIDDEIRAMTPARAEVA